MIKYPQEELRELFFQLPERLRTVILSEQTANSIRKIAEWNKISSQVSILAILVGRVLMGLLPPDQFIDTLVKELKIKKEQASKIFYQVNRFILFPVKDELEKFYKEVQFLPRGRILKRKEKETPKTEQKIDIYREPIE